LDRTEQDDDKQIAYSTARNQYNPQYTLVFLDSDELFSPKSLITQYMRKNGKWIYPEYTHAISNTTINQLQSVVKAHFNNIYYKSLSEEVYYNRWAVGGVVPGGVVHIKKFGLDGDIVATTNNCILNGKC